MKLGLLLPSALVVTAVSSSALSAPTTVSVTIGTTVTKEPPRTNSPPEQINFTDCAANAILTFGITRMGFTTNSDLNIQVWGQNDANCADDNVRNNTTGCWKVADVSPTDNTVDVRAQDIVAQRSIPPAAGPEVCTMPPVSPQSDFVLAFLVFNNSGVSQVPMPALWPPTGTGRYDVVGPRPPTNVTASPGGDSAILSFDASTDDDLSGYNAFCTVATSAGDVDGGGCAGEGLAPGQLPTAPAFECGDTGEFAEGLTAEGLEDATVFAIAVSARDDLDNNGPLSELTCVTPKPTTGYYEAYRAAGGTAGGGFCTLSRRPSPFSAAAMLLALAGLACRRRRQP
jgi:hypothetical protein